MRKGKQKPLWFSKVQKFGLITLAGWVTGIPLLICGIVFSIPELTITGIVLIGVSFFTGMAGVIVVFFSYVKRLAKKKAGDQGEDSELYPIKEATRLTYNQRGMIERGEYAANIFADSINAYHAAPRKIKIATVLSLIIVFSGVALFITGIILTGAKVQPLGYIIMFSGFGSGAGFLIVMLLVQNLPQRLRAKSLRGKPKTVKVYEKEATVLQSLMHSSREYGTERIHFVKDIVYNVFLNCESKTLSALSFNYYKRGAKIRVYIEAAKPKNVYIALENLIIPIVIESKKTEQ